MNFWDVIKEVSAQPVRNEASRLFVLGLAGDPEPVAAARSLALGPLTIREAEEAREFLFCATPPYSEEAEKRLRYADLLVSLPGGPGVTELRPADTLKLERPTDLFPAVLERRPDLRVSLARRLPGFRPLAAEQVIRDVSRVNAEFAAVSSLSGSLPFLAPLFPAFAGADVLVLTKNQVLLIFRLAAIYGESLDLTSRAREVAGVVGSALGWRTLARQIAGAVPGLGVGIKAGIAYSGTYAVGRAAQMVFDEGRRPNRQEMLRIYEEATTLAKETAARVLEAAAGRRREPGSNGSKVEEAATPALPAGEPAPADAEREPREV
ncbi:MAG: hypothetical protein ACK47B_25610 [Armatimonadota bacterium]